MEGLRKVILTSVTLLLETGAFVFMVLVAHVADAGVLTAYFVAVGGTLSVFVAGNVATKIISPAPPVEPPKG
jgi:hypothetical protein